MKQNLYLLAAALLTGAGAVAQTTVTVNPSEVGDTPFFPCSPYFSVNSGSQSFYSAELLEAATEGCESITIQQINYLISQIQVNPTSYINIELYAAVTDADYTGPLNDSAFTLVYSGTKDFSESEAWDNAMPLELTTPITVNKGQNLVLGFKGNHPDCEGPLVAWAVSKPDEEVENPPVLTYYSESKFTTFGEMAQTSANLPSIQLVYTGEGGGVTPPLKELNIDAILSGSANLSAGETGTYNVMVRNWDTETLSGYTVNLLDASGNVLSSNDKGADIASYGNASVSFTQTFAEPGVYPLTAEVVKTGYEAVKSASFSVKVSKALPADVLTAQIVAPVEGSQMETILNGNSEAYASQVLYTPDIFADYQSDIDIYSLTFTTLNQSYANMPSYPVKIWMAKTDKTDGYTRFERSTLVPQDDFVLVYDGSWAPRQNDASEDYTFVLDTPFTLEKGSGLAVNITIDGNDGNPTIWFLGHTTEQPQVAYSRTNDSAATADWNVYDESAYMYTGNRLPATKIAYTAAAVADKTDLAVVAGNNWPTEAEIGQELTFPVTVTNEGTLDVESYTLELLDYSEDLDNPTVLTQTEVTRYLAAGATANGKITYKFDKGGAYYLGARVVVEGDENDENNTTEPEVLEVALPEVDLQVVGLTGDTDVKAGEEVEYTVEVYNGGAERVSTFTLQIETTDNRTLLAQENVQSPIFSMGTSYLAIPVKFEQAGTYSIVARVVIDGDADESNNVSEPLTVEVESNNDAINSIFGENDENVEIYNLQGVRVTNISNLPAGIYIVNGKKINVK